MVGRVVSDTLRASDLAARFGGEEFLLLLPDTDRRGAIEVAEKVRVAIEAIELPRAGALTGSLGVACLPEDAVEPDQLLRKADRALYAAKARGRNRVPGAEAGADPRWGDERSHRGGSPASLTDRRRRGMRGKQRLGKGNLRRVKGADRQTSRRGRSTFADVSPRCEPEAPLNTVPQPPTPRAPAVYAQLRGTSGNARCARVGRM